MTQKEVERLIKESREFHKFARSLVKTLRSILRRLK